jgi:hypothetical protein
MAFRDEIRRVSRRLARRRGSRTGEVRTFADVASPRDRRFPATALTRGSACGSRLALAALLALAACEPYVQGNGHFLEENRTSALASFRGVSVEDGVEVTVTANTPAAQRSVVVSGDSNLVPYIRTSIVMDRVPGVPILHVSIADLTGGYDPTIPPRVVVKEELVEYLRASGKSRIQVQGAATSLLTVAGEDRSEISVAAPALTTDAGDALVVTLAGQSSLDATSYPVKAPDATSAAATVTLSGGSRAALHADAAEIPLTSPVQLGVAVTGTASGELTVVDNRRGHGSSEVQLSEAASYCPPAAASCP